MLLLSLLVYASALERVVLVSRHGERQRLVKDALTQQEEGAVGGPLLTATGAAAEKALGQLLRQRYTRPGGCTDRCLNGQVGNGVYAQDEVHAESSGLARTLQSAYALHAGLFPQGSVESSGGEAVQVPLPVYSRPTGEDFILRGYTMCTAQARNLEAWQSSPEFLTKASETKAFRSRMAQLLGRVNISEDGTAAPLADWWNTYDEIAVAAQAPTGSAVNASDLQEAETLAAWLEAVKFGPKLAGTKCGGALLHEVGLRLLDEVKYPDLRLTHFSAHYATMLCLLSALGVPDYTATDSWIRQELLGLSSVLAFEVAKIGTGERVVGLYYWPGPDSSTTTETTETTESWRLVQLPCGDPAGRCSTKQFESIVARRGLGSLKAWCTACDNFELKLCAAPVTPATGTISPKRPQWDLPAVVFVFLGVGASAFLAAGCYAFRKSFRGCLYTEEESRSMIAERAPRAPIGACSPAPSL